MPSLGRLSTVCWVVSGAALTSAVSAPGPHFCGNGLVEAGEACDDGELNGSTNSCCAPGCVLTDKRPDLIVSSIGGSFRFGTSAGVTAYAVTTEVCNLGSCWLSWLRETPAHPVIAQNMFRLKDGRLEQVGQAWVKHGFGALDGNSCGFCTAPPSSDYLGVNCSDPYSASTNGFQRGMGPKGDVNPYTGGFPFPDARIDSTGDVIFKRLQVHNVDLDPAFNPGARYFIEVQYVTPDDPGSRNGNDNVSHREVVVGPAPYGLAFVGPTERAKAAIRAWKAADPEVLETEVDAEGLFLLAARATPLATGGHRYEYALQNLTSHRAGRSFAVPIPPGAVVTNVGFHDVDYHSGEPFQGTPWDVTVSSDAVRWSTEAHDVNPNANALRWGTLYNFRFDADVGPGTSSAEIGLFRPGTPESVTVRTVTPEPCVAAADGASCDDGDGCTSADSCQGGVCTGGNTVACTASDPCHDAGTCDPSTGACSNPAKPEGGACDDGDACTGPDVCQGGTCRGLQRGSPPAEVDEGVRLSASGGSTTLTWNAAAGSTSSAVLRGSIGQLPVGPGGADEVCLDGAVAGTSLTDLGVPEPGSAFWYLVQGTNACGPGPYGSLRVNGVPTLPRASTTCP